MLCERPEVELVVARYREDVCWVDQFGAFSVVVYDKSDEKAERYLPNVGREAHTYLHHIISIDLLPMPSIYKPVERIKERHWWQTWLKPFYIFDSPFERTLWIDADCVIVGDLEVAFQALEEQPLLVRDGTTAPTENHRSLYDHLGLPEGTRTNGVSLNAGVVGLCTIRDRDLLHAWGFGVGWAALNPARQHLSAWADQGILLWAAHVLVQQIFVKGFRKEV